MSARLPTEFRRNMRPGTVFGYHDCYGRVKCALVVLDDKREIDFWTGQKWHVGRAMPAVAFVVLSQGVGEQTARPASSTIIHVALCGPAGAGKSTVANHLVDVYGAKRYSFAQPLKEMVKRALDFTDEQVYGTQAQKEAIDPRYGHSPRWFLQQIGTEGCRAVFGDNFLTKRCLEMIDRARPALAVIEDLRFDNEAQAVLNENEGFVWRLWPVDDAVSAERAAAAGAHSSEEQWRTLEANLEIRPTKRGITELLELIDRAMGMIGLIDGVRSEGMRW